MKIAISNIAWQAGQDIELYRFLEQAGVNAIEIAPTRIFPDNPYGDNIRAADFRAHLKNTYNLAIASLQSICYGRDEAIFGTPEESAAIKEYIKKAIDFASALQCINLVFGSPKNRNIQPGQEQRALSFFSEIGEHAANKNTIFALEPNPDIYGTNFINTTAEALDFVKKVNMPALKVNLDLGTIIYNNEDLALLNGNISFINHVHISEPYLEEIKKRKIHNELSDILKANGYTGYISIEMKSGSTIGSIKEIIQYIQDVFKN